MVNLKRLRNREIPFTMGGETYHGKVVEGFSHVECSYNSNNGNRQKAYYYEVKDTGRRIPISHRTVMMKEGGLVFKLDSAKQ